MVNEFQADVYLYCYYVLLIKKKIRLAKVGTILSMCLHCLVVNESFSGILVAK